MKIIYQLGVLLFVLITPSITFGQTLSDSLTTHSTSSENTKFFAQADSTTLDISKALKDLVKKVEEIHLKDYDNITWKLYPTTNMYTFLKLDTRNGIIYQLQYSTKGDDYRFETYLNASRLAYGAEAVNGRFALYPTQNMYNFILLDQIDGRAWQVQWSLDKKERMIIRIY